MDYQAIETILLNDDEFQVMLAAAGRQNWYGIELRPMDAGAPDGGAVNRAMTSLYQKEYIDWHGDKAVIAEPYRQAFRVLRDASCCILAVKYDAPYHVTASYFAAGHAVIVARSRTVRDEVGLTLLTEEEWFGQMIGDGYLPELIHAAEDWTPSRTFAWEADREPGDILEQPGVVSVFEQRLVPSGRRMEQLVLCDAGLYGEAFRIREEATVCDICSEALFRSVIGAWIGGEQ